MKPQKRVVITGIGIVSAIGTGKDAFAAAMRAGQSGRVPIARFDASGMPFHYAHEVRNFPFATRNNSSDRVLEYGWTAAQEALQNSGADLTQVDPFRFAVSISSSKGGVDTLTGLLEIQNEPYFAARAKSRFLNIFPDQAAMKVAAKVGARGPVKSWVGACATGNLALAEAFYLLSNNEADCVLAGASDASLSPLMLTGYHQMKALTADRMRPFDEARDGFLAGEGAAVFFLETLESAKARGAKIYAEIAAVAMGQETSHALFFSDEESTLSRTTTLAIERASQTAADIDYVNLHGTATQHGDLYETREIKKTFGTHAYSLSTSTIKPMTGHMLGAAGAVEIAATLLAMDKSFVPPTLGLEKPDAECDLNYTAGSAAEKKIRNALSISMGFGGQTAAVLFRKV